VRATSDPRLTIGAQRAREGSPHGGPKPGRTLSAAPLAQAVGRWSRGWTGWPNNVRRTVGSGVADLSARVEMWAPEARRCQRSREWTNEGFGRCQAAICANVNRQGTNRANLFLMSRYPKAPKPVYGLPRGFQAYTEKPQSVEDRRPGLDKLSMGHAESRRVVCKYSHVRILAGYLCCTCEYYPWATETGGRTPEKHA